WTEHRRPRSYGFSGPASPGAALPRTGTHPRTTQPSGGFVMQALSGLEAPALVPLEEDAESHVALGEGRRAAAIPRPGTVDPPRVLWAYASAVIGFHLLLPLAFVPWLFSWTGLLAVPLGNYLFCSLGIGAGYHRLLTHRSFRCSKWLEHMFA